MRLICAWGLGVAMLVAGCSKEEVKTDFKDVRMPPASEKAATGNMKVNKHLPGN